MIVMANVMLTDATTSTFPRQMRTGTCDLCTHRSELMPLGVVGGVVGEVRVVVDGEGVPVDGNTNRTVYTCATRKQYNCGFTLRFSATTVISYRCSRH